VGSKTRMKKGIERYCSIVGCLNEAFIEEGVKIEYLREDIAVLEDTAAGEVSIIWFNMFVMSWFLMHSIVCLLLLLDGCEKIAGESKLSAAPRGRLAYS
jgi:hypothetical protein